MQIIFVYTTYYINHNQPTIAMAILLAIPKPIIKVVISQAVYYTHFFFKVHFLLIVLRAAVTPTFALLSVDAKSNFTACE